MSVKFSTRTMVIASILVIATAAIGATAALRLFQWQPKIFAIEVSIVDSTFNQMRKEKDSVLLAIEKDRPDFAKVFAAETSRRLGIALNSVIVPADLMSAAAADIENASSSSRDVRDTSRLGFYIGKTIKNLVIFAFNNAVENSKGPAASEDFKYKYCEQNPTNLDPPCDRGGNEIDYNGLRNNSREYILVRRLISHPSFIKGICPSVTPFAVWYMNWGWGMSPGNLTGKAARYERFFIQLKDLIAEIRTGQLPANNETSAPGGGKATPLPLDPQIEDFIYRRYLDGGDDFLSALQACATDVQLAFSTQDITPSPDAERSIANLISFRPTGAKDGSSVASASIEADALYRLSHTIESSQPLPETVWFNSSGTWDETVQQKFDSTQYLVTISGVGEFNPVVTLPLRELAILESFDSKNRYSVLTANDFNRLIKENPALFSEDEVFCVIDRAPKNEKDMDNLKFLIYNLGHLQPLDPNAQDACFPSSGSSTKTGFLILKTPR